MVTKENDVGCLTMYQWKYVYTSIYPSWPVARYRGVWGPIIALIRLLLMHVWLYIFFFQGTWENVHVHSGSSRGMWWRIPLRIENRGWAIRTRNPYRLCYRFSQFHASFSANTDRRLFPVFQVLNAWLYFRSCFNTSMPDVIFRQTGSFRTLQVYWEKIRPKGPQVQLF